MLINTKNPDKRKEFVAEINDGISDLKDRIKKMSETEKKKKKQKRHKRILKKKTKKKKKKKMLMRH